MFWIVLIVNISATLFMTGLIWFIQAVQYPGFLKIKRNNFQTFHLHHIARVSPVVIPPMLIEMVTSVWLVTAYEQFKTINVIGLVILLGIWISTFTIQLPYHKQLQMHSDRETINKLIKSNWIRTILWSIKAVIGILLLLMYF